MPAPKVYVTPMDVATAAIALRRRLPIANVRQPLNVHGVPRGGIPAAFAFVAACAGTGTIAQIVDRPEHADLFVDDIYDSGATAAKYREEFPKAVFDVLFDKRTPEWSGQWLVMPWEGNAQQDSSADDIVTRLFQYIGEDPTREGLRDTPKRFLKAWTEWASGYNTDPKDVLRTFVDGAQNVDEMVVVHNIPVISKCEHHLADMIGVAHIGYIPSGRIVGLSKLPRLMDVFARRLQVQERMTTQVAAALQEHLAPHGVGVVVRCAHACMSTRGVKIHGSVTSTSAMLGRLRESPAARQEFMTLISHAEANR